MWNYEVLAKKILDESFVVNQDLLIDACGLNDSGIIRLLLLHRSTDPNLVLLESIRHSNIDIVIALVEDERTKVTNQAMLAACKLGRKDVVDIFLKDKRFNVNTSSSDYLIESIRNDRIAVVLYLLDDKRFYQSILCGLIEACKCKNAYIFEQIAKKFPDVPKNTEIANRLTLEAINSYNVDVLNKVLEYTDDKGVNIDSAIACLFAGKSQLFKVLITKLDIEPLKKLLFTCIERNLSTKISLINDLKKISIGIEEIVVCINHDSIHSLNMCIKLGVPSCSQGICCIKGAIVHHRDKIASALILADEGKNKCTHYLDNLRLAISNECFGSVKELLIHRKVSKIPEDILDDILFTGNRNLLEYMLTYVAAIPPEKIRMCMQKGHFEMIKLICEKTVVDISWKNYELLRYAALFNGPQAYDSLLPCLQKSTKTIIK